MSVDRDIRYELLARLCPNSTGKWLIKFFGLFLYCSYTEVKSCGIP
jgi:hypothetical protein